jgi:tRNA threonylcarbamoyladenosine modification (KEOPS) complex  Pcc1 subunit
MNAKADVRLQFSSEKQIKALIDALTPEIKKHIGTRSQVALTRDTQFLVLSVKAKDTAALRAALNTYLRWINSALNVLETVETEQP